MVVVTEQSVGSDGVVGCGKDKDTWTIIVPDDIELNQVSILWIMLLIKKDKTDIFQYRQYYFSQPKKLATIEDQISIS